MIENQKGATNLISTMAYLLISFAILAMVTTSAMDLLSKSKEQANYEVMLDTFEKINLVLKDSITNKQEIDLKINNPEEIEIDCTNNKIIGKITYHGNYKTEETIISDVVTYKKGDYVYFEKDITNLGNITLNCKDKLLPKGKITLTINYFEYDSSTKTISLDISHNTKDHNVSWYNSNWAYRKKITIDHTKVEEDLYNFPLLLKIDPITEIETLTEEQIEATLDLSYVNSDGSGIVFTLDDGKTKLKREIEYINSVGLLPYYIEETSSKRYVWTKLDLGANEIKTLTIKKTTNNSPDGDEVFEFFDDFDGTSLDSQKWGYSQAFTTTGLINLTAYPGNLALYRSFVVSKNPIDAQNRIYKLRYRSERVASAYDNGFVVMGRDYDKSCADNSGVQFGNNISVDSLYQISTADSCSNSIYSSIGTIVNFGIYLNYEAIVNSDNTQVKQIVSTDGGITINDSNWITPSATYTRSQGYLALNTYNSTGSGGRVRYDYVFVRKYIETEPTVVVNKSGDSFTVTITNNTSQTLTDYQVKIPAEDLEVYSKTRSLEIIDTSFPPNNNTLIAWVKLPKLDSTKDTSIYMYYGNPNGNEINDKDTWDSNYLMIQHFSETPNNTTNGFLDSTSYLNHGTPEGFKNTAESNTRLEGLIDGAITLGDTENVVVVQNNQELNNLNKFTFSAWIKPKSDVSTETRTLLVKPLDDWQEPFYLYSFDINQGMLGLGISDGTTREYLAGGTIVSEVWQHIAGVYDGNSLKLYINGNLDANQTISTLVGENTNNLLIGNALQTGTDYFGYLDELKISKTNRTSSWIKTEFLNQSNPYAFYSFGLKEYQ